MDLTAMFVIFGLILMCDKSRGVLGQDGMTSEMDENEVTHQELGQGSETETHAGNAGGLLDSVRSLGQARDPVLFKLLGQALRYRSFTDLEIADFLSEVADKLRWRQQEKRSWNRVNVQPRFATFGTKLVPNRKMENNGATLLRYGRNA